MQRLTISESNLEQLFGTRDENLRYLEERLGISVRARGAEVQLNGEEQAERIAARLLASSISSSSFSTPRSRDR